MSAYEPVRAARLAWERTQPQLFFDLAVGDHEHATERTPVRDSGADTSPEAGADPTASTYTGPAPLSTPDARGGAR